MHAKCQEIFCAGNYYDFWWATGSPIASMAMACARPNLVRWAPPTRPHLRLGRYGIGKPECAASRSSCENDSQQGV